MNGNKQLQAALDLLNRINSGISHAVTTTIRSGSPEMVSIRIQWKNTNDGEFYFWERAFTFGSLLAGKYDELEVFIEHANEYIRNSYRNRIIADSTS